MSKTFKSQIPNHLAEPKSITAVGVSLEVGQAKALGENLSMLMSRPYFEAENIVIVLPNEYMLFPVLHALPKELKDINITMGLPILRVSPDHGPNIQMFKKNKSNPLSLIKALNFLDKK